jgi:RNA polymerase sigma-70 factor (ECF subfamily)
MTLTIDSEELIPTRKSLLSRLKNWDDHQSWKSFFDTYWRLIYKAAVRTGLTDAEAQEVVQETVIAVCKSMPGFTYDESKGQFKGWLLRLTKWRINDLLRKRKRRQHLEAESLVHDDHALDVADPSRGALEESWDKEWEANLFEAAIERIKQQVDGRQYQTFDLYVLKKWPVNRVAKSLGTSTASVYLAKHRIGNLLKREVAKLRTKPI